MRRAVKVKIANARVLPRKAKVATVPSVRRTFPAWVDVDERGVAFPAASVTKRVRDGLVLRIVGQKKKTVAARKSSDGPAAR